MIFSNIKESICMNITFTLKMQPAKPIEWLKLIKVSLQIFILYVINNWLYRFSVFFVLVDVADSYIKISSALIQLATFDNSDLEKFYSKTADTFEKARKVEGRIASDEDLKLSDLLRYYMRDTSAAKVI